MPEQPKENNASKKRLDPTIVVALIGLIGTIIAALFASWVRNTQNSQVDYTLTVQDALTPPPP